MKKVTFMMIACAALMASCNGNKTNTAANGAAADSAATDTAAAGADSTVYEGMLPAADVEGIRYHVVLNGDSTFALNEAYMETETKVGENENYSGKTETISKDGSTYYKLAMGKNDALMLKVLNDSTLRVVGPDFREAVAAEGMNYDLKLKK
jgi:uncharacterized lipoprotein NlpE involved in copper resistance